MLSAVWCDYLGQMLTIFLSCLAVIVSTNQVVYKSRDKNFLPHVRLLRMTFSMFCSSRPVRSTIPTSVRPTGPGFTFFSELLGQLGISQTKSGPDEVIMTISNISPGD